MTAPINHHSSVPCGSPAGSSPSLSRPACRNIFATLKHRWRNHMPVFFRRVFWVCSLISGTAITAHYAMQAAGAVPHAWWQDIYPYLVAFPAGMAFAAKFTQQYLGQPIDYDTYRRTITEATTAPSPVASESDPDTAATAATDHEPTAPQQQ